MRYKVKLRLVQDTSDWDYELGGFVPAMAYSDKTFDPFWSPEGIFHDIFEHWFEGLLPRFTGKKMFSVYGEMVATGAQCYFYHLGVNTLQYRKPAPNDRDFRADTEYLIIDHLRDGEARYPLEPIFATTIPPSDSYFDNAVESFIEEYICQIQLKVGGYTPKKQLTEVYKQIRSAYRYGWKLAKRIWHKDRSESADILGHMLEKFQKLTNHADPKYISIEGAEYGIKYLVATVDSNTERKVHLQWEDDVRNLHPFDKWTSY
jgi:hypothetical protein